MTQVVKYLKTVQANTYTLYLKTQNFHWHVTGEQFFSVHKLLEAQYQDLGAAIDDIAERIVMLGDKALGTFEELLTYKTIAEAPEKIPATKAMLTNLMDDHYKVIECLKECTRIAQDHDDIVTDNLMADRLAFHEKAAWMLRATTHAK